MVGTPGLIIIVVIFLISCVLIIHSIETFDRLRQDYADRTKTITRNFFVDIEKLEEDKARYMKLYNELL